MKKSILILILIFPSLLYFLFELSEANFTRLPFYGPKTIAANRDTVYYALKPQLYNFKIGNKYTSDSIKFPVYAIKFISKEESKEAFHLGQLSEIIRIKPSELKNVNLVIASEKVDSQIINDLNLSHPSITYVTGDKTNFETSYMLGKPYYVNNGFIILIDKARRIRGYYNGNYADEVKRFVKEYQHLTLRDEQKTIKENTKIERK